MCFSHASGPSQDCSRMCGITGIVMAGGSSLDPVWLQRMNDALIHRGPDGEGTFVDGPVGLGHRRLSIIDLEGGKQPIGNEDGSVQVTFNGEIYNYRELRERLEGLGHVFATASDTEVLAHGWEQWGTELVRHLRGMFAFAVWDSKQRSVFLARDRVGIKPLLYTQQDGYFAFASEMQAITTLPELRTTTNLAAIDQYLHYQYIPAPFTIYNEVHKLPPGHTLLLELPHLTVGSPNRYWQLQFEPDRSLNESQWLERIDEALEETIRAHLVSDVPFGAFLSGGIDSSTVVAYMSRVLKEPVEAFCIGHGDQAYDERNWAQEAAEATGANYHEEVVQPDGLELLPELVRHYGEPFADSSAIATWYVSRMARRHVKMVLSGDGGDELFAGYNAYASILADHRIPTSPTKRIKNLVANGARQAGLWPKNASIADSKFRRTSVLSLDQRAGLWRSEHANVVNHTRAEFDRTFADHRSRETLNHLQAYDLATYIPYDNLVKVDIASMFHSLEVRVPLLDHVFMELAAKVPPELKLLPADGNGNGRVETLVDPTNVTGKHLLKKNAERFFSREFLYRPKRGFEVPIRNWFDGPHRDTLRDRLLGRGSHLNEYFEPSALTSLVDDAAHDKKAAWAAWSLLVLEQWHSETTAA
ncbi:MAG: asparagine synthase (glutamine-hydrolyzing) [Planctomycetota bacterium]